jgi:hypothetical protein
VLVLKHDTLKILLKVRAVRLIGVIKLNGRRVV